MCVHYQQGRCVCVRESVFLYMYIFICKYDCQLFHLYVVLPSIYMQSCECRYAHTIYMYISPYIDVLMLRCVCMLVCVCVGVCMALNAHIQSLKYFHIYAYTHVMWR